MAGVNDLTAQILKDAREKADGIIADAESKAKDTVDQAKKEALEVSEKAKAQAEKDASDYAARIRSQIGMQTRQKTLKTRQDIIEQVIDMAYKKLASMDDASYFAMITSLVAKNAHREAGEILFSKKDLERLPEGFGENLQKVIPEGASLTVSTECAPIEDGFVLRYGGIEENCSLKALFAEKQEDLRDKVHQVLWING